MSAMAVIAISLFLMSRNALSIITTDSASGHIAGGTLTTTTGHISRTSKNIQTANGTVSNKNESFQTVACTGTITTSPASRWIFMGLDSTTRTRIVICADPYQYIEFTTMTSNKI